MRSVFEQIKDRINLVEYIGKYIRLRPVAGKYVGLCPFHTEKTPSFHVDGTKQLFHCFGCNCGGDLFEFYMRYNNVDKKEALRALADLAGVSLTSTPIREKSQLDIVSAYFAQHLANDANVQQLLRERGVSAESIAKFSIGLAPDASTIGRFLKEKNLNLASYGFNDYSWKMFENRIMFPIYDANSMLCSFGGRVYKPGDKRAKYINGSASKSFIKSQILYGLNFTKRLKPIYVVEGYLDVIIMQQHGYYAVAPMGTAFGVEHLAAVLERTDEIIIAMDGDVAGRKSAMKTALMALENLKVDSQIKFIDFPQGYDAASYLHQFQSLEKLRQYHLYEYIFLFEYALLVNMTPEKSAQGYKNLMALASKIKDSVLKSEYRKKWKDLWWNRNKKVQELATIPHENHISLLLFKYILLYPDILDAVSEHFARLPIEALFKQNSQALALYTEQLMHLLNHEDLNIDFQQQIMNVQLVEDIHSASDALAAWHKIAAHIEQLADNDRERHVNALQQSFCQTEWEKFKQWIAANEPKDE